MHRLQALDMETFGRLCATLSMWETEMDGVIEEIAEILELSTTVCQS